MTGAVARPARFLTAALAVAQSYAVLPMMTPIVWMPAAEPALGLSPIEAGELCTITLFAVAFGTLVLSSRLMRFDARKTVLLGSAVVMLTNLLTVVLHPSAVGFSILRLLEGIAGGVCVGITSILAAAGDSPARTFSIMFFAESVIGVVLFLIAGPMLAKAGLDGLFAIAALGWFVVPIAALGLPSWTFMRPTGSLPMTPGAKPRVETIISCAGLLLFFMAQRGAFSSVGYLILRLGLPLTRATPVMAAALAFCALGALVGGEWSRRTSWRVILISMGIGEILFISGVGIAGTYWILAFAMCGILFCMYAAVPVLFAHISTLDDDGWAAAAVQTAALCGIALGPLNANLLTHLTSLSAMGLLSSGESTVGLALMLFAHLARKGAVLGGAATN